MREKRQRGSGFWPCPSQSQAFTNLAAVRRTGPFGSAQGRLPSVTTRAVIQRTVLCFAVALRAGPRDKRVSGDEVTQRLVGGLHDPDARRDCYAAYAIAVVDNSEV